MELPEKYKKFEPAPKTFPGFPVEPTNNYWRYPRIVDGWWHQLSGSEQKVLDYILRHTWGYDKEIDAISLSQFESGVYSKKSHQWIDQGTGLTRPSITKALKGLIQKGFIVVIRAVRRHYTNHYFLKTKNTKTSDISLNDFLFQKFKGKCFYCGVDLILTEKGKYYSTEEALRWFEVDHRYPKSRGGSDRIENFAASCRQCNGRKGNKSDDEFMDKMGTSRG